MLLGCGSASKERSGYVFSSGGTNSINSQQAYANFKKKSALPKSYFKFKKKKVIGNYEVFPNELSKEVKKLKSVKKDEKKWLFVIGIEKYLKTDKVNYSIRSAELFANAALKTLGIPPENTFLIVDDGKTSISNLKGRTYRATAGSLKDQLRYLIRDINDGDEIYFYYSGHGVPVTTDDNKPYIMARDMAPDFLADEPFFKVENIYNMLGKSKAGKVVIFMDSCFTGITDGKSVFGGNKAAITLGPKKVQINKKKLAVLTAGNEKQFSNAYKKKGHRLFSYFVIKAMLSKNSKIKSFYSDVLNNTKNTSRKLGGSNIQTPVLIGNQNINIR